MARYAPDPAQRVTVFLGEAGCGKSELAVQWALTAAERGRDVHFFDLDQNKATAAVKGRGGPLEGAGVTVHFEQQCADAPTQVGGLVPLLLDKSKSVILDVGGNDTGGKAHRRIRTPAEERGRMVRGKPVPALVGDGGAHRRDPERRAEGGAPEPPRFFAEPHAGHRHHGGGILSGCGAGAPAADALCKGGGGGGVGDAAAGGRGRTELPLLPLTPRMTVPETGLDEG